MQKTLYIGLDVHKESIAVSVADEGRNEPIRYLGPIPNTPVDVASMAKRLAKNGMRLEFCYEAGCCGYGIHRQLTTLGHGCMVVAPTLIPKKPGERIKTDRRDSQKLAVLLRSGDLTPVWVPDKVHEAMRDLVRARAAAAAQLTQARQQTLAFLLRHGQVYTVSAKHWTYKHRQWLASQAFEFPAHQIVFQDYMEAVMVAESRCDALLKSIDAQLTNWSMKPLVDALRGLRGMDTISAVTFVAVVGDLGRFQTPRQLMAYLGLVPSEYSSGDRILRGGITKTGNREARRMLVEAAWCYRYPARVAVNKSKVLATLPKYVRDTAWKAQIRLCGRFRQMMARGKNSTVVVAAIARELSGFIWAIGQEVKPAMP